MPRGVGKLRVLEVSSQKLQPRENSTLDQMVAASLDTGAGVLHAVVLLGPFRCNGNYNELMSDMVALSRVPGLLAGVTVVTAHIDPSAAAAENA